MASLIRSAGLPLGPAVKDQIPGVQMVARLKRVYKSPIITVGAQRFEEKGMFYADPDILKIFSFPLVSGNPATALASPDGVLLTEATARRYFGTADAMGKMIRMDSSVFTVTGILKDIPANSHIHFDLLFPMSKLWDDWGMIIGVVKDFSFKPAQSVVDPLILRYNPSVGKEWLRRTAVVIASPIAWFFMQQWLSDFAFRIDISVWYFLGAGVMALVIALVTVSFQVVRAAMANPVKSLRMD